MVPSAQMKMIYMHMSLTTPDQTLLALGNGSPDLGSTINAILLWNESPPVQTTILANNTTTIHKTAAEGWTMSLGSLTGGGMFVGTIVTGLIVQSTNGIPCRGAFLRDVSMYALSIGMVWHVLESNRVTQRDVYMLLGMWMGYVTIVFLADMYHRKVTLPRLHAEGKERRKSLKLEKLKRLSAIANNTTVDNKQKENIVAAVDGEEIRFGGDEKFSLVASVSIFTLFTSDIVCALNSSTLITAHQAPLSLYGFFIATTWIDVIGNNLVGLLQFLGTICRIQAPILGVTVLAWGNSLGDLSANVAMARKGMPDMVTTANFAGPSFNLLLGVGLGFLSLQNKLETDTIYPV